VPVDEAHTRGTAARPAYHGRPGAPRRARCRVGTPAGLHSRAERARPVARRSAVVGGFAVLLATCAVWVQGGGGRTGSDPLAAPGAGRTAPAAAHVWVVQPGDTLWAIAERLDPGGDPRPVVAQLEAQVGSDTLQPGERLRLP